MLKVIKIDTLFDNKSGKYSKLWNDYKNMCPDIFEMYRVQRFSWSWMCVLKKYVFLSSQYCITERKS